MAIPRSRPKNLAIQQRHLRSLFPDAQCWIRRSELTFIVDLTPTPISETYKIQLKYKLGKPPKVTVLEPKLEPIDGYQLPHTYKDGSLCLYLPRAGDWSWDMLLVETIVPWASEWLTNYETWVTTGLWLGGGTHPEEWDRPSS